MLKTSNNDEFFKQFIERKAFMQQSDPKPDKPPFIQQLDEWLDKKYTDECLKVEDMVKGVGLLNSRQLNNKIKAFTEIEYMTARKYLIQFRLQKAAEHLKCGKLPGEVVKLTGFSDHAMFSKYFKEKYNKTPVEYAKKSQPEPMLDMAQTYPMNNQSKLRSVFNVFIYIGLILITGVLVWYHNQSAAMALCCPEAPVTPFLPA